jgi:uncharacterized integral membrane protein
MSRFKPYAVAAIALIAVIVSLQNTQSVDTRILFFTISVPRVILLALTFLLGMVAGVLTTLYWRQIIGQKRSD